MNVARTGEVKSAITSDFGVKYVVEGVISGPGGRRAVIRTVWVVETGQDRPRLITAYPLIFDQFTMLQEAAWRSEPRFRWGPPKSEAGRG